MTGSLSKPSSVVISARSAATAKVMQDRAGAPSISTVQAPHTPCSQPTCVRGQRLMLAQEVGEVQPRLDLGFDTAAVDGERQRFHGAARLLRRALQCDQREVSDVFVLDVLVVEKPQDGLLVEAFGHVGRKGAAEQRACVGNNDGSRLDRADHGAKAAAGRIVQHAADRVRKFAGLLAELVEAPARARRKLRDADRADDLVGPDHRGE